MRVAVIGGGVSGLVAAYRLGPHHDVTLYEANDYLGGHAHTVEYQAEGQRWAIDTGFIVFNDWNYPEFTKLLDELQVASQPTSMSFSCQTIAAANTRRYEYNGSSLSGLFAQRRNLVSWRFQKMLCEILRFNRAAKQLLRDGQDSSELTVQEFLDRQGYSAFFARHYLLPMGAAIWSAPLHTFAEFPLSFVAEFFENHGLLNLWHRPQWRVIRGGSKTYVEKLHSKLQTRVRLNTPIKTVTRSETGVTILPAAGPTQDYDHVVMACHSDQALRLLADPTPLEREVLTAIPYQRNTAILHTDPSLMPRSKRAWASWNVRLESGEQPRAIVTYWMNMLQGLEGRQQFFVSLNAEDLVDPSAILGRYEYEHPIFTTARARIQRRHSELLDVNHTSYAGAYWRNGFHEDGVVSANRVAAVLNRMPCLSV